MIVKRLGFTLLEMMVVMLLIGVVATFLLPRLMKRSPLVEWKTILSDMNDLALFARQEAITNQKIYRLVFCSNQQGVDEITIEDEQDDQERPGKKKFMPVFSFYFSTKYRFAEQVKIKAVFLGKQEMIENQRGVAYCYIIPDGLVQEVLVHLIRKIDNVETGASFAINPFDGRFQLYDGFIKPERTI